MLINNAPTELMTFTQFYGLDAWWTSNEFRIGLVIITVVAIIITCYIIKKDMDGF